MKPETIEKMKIMPSIINSIANNGETTMSDDGTALICWNRLGEYLAVTVTINENGNTYYRLFKCSTDAPFDKSWALNVRYLPETIDYLFDYVDMQEHKYLLYNNTDPWYCPFLEAATEYVDRQNNL